MEGVLDEIVIGVRIKRHGDLRIAVPHHILQGLGVKPGLLHIGAEGVAQYVRRNGRQRISVELSILPLHLTHIVLQMHGDLRLFIGIQKEESSASVNNHLHRWFRTCFYHTPESLICYIRQGNRADAAAGFRWANEIRLVARPAELPSYIQATLGEINIRQSDSVKLTDTQPGFQQDHNIVIINSASVVPEEFQILLLLCRGQRDTLGLVIGEKLGEVEAKWILPDGIVVHRHLESGTR